MRKIYSQSIDSHRSQLTLDKLAKLLGIAKSRVLEKILNSIETDDLEAFGAKNGVMSILDSEDRT